MSDIAGRLRDTHPNFDEKPMCNEAADENERLRASLREYVNTVVEMEGVTFLEQMKNAELRLCIESILAEEPQG